MNNNHIEITSRIATSLFKLLIYIYFFVIFSSPSMSYVGMNWGRMASQRLIPSMVVDLLLQNGIHEIKLFSPGPNILRALAGSKIGVTIGIPNDRLNEFTSIQAVREFLYDNIMQSLEDDVKIRYITVGSQPFSPIYFNRTYFYVFDVLQFFQTVLKEEKFAKYNIKATMSHYTDVLVDTTIPSKGEFNLDVKSYVTRACKLLEQDNAPVLLDLFLIDRAKKLFNNDTEFAFIDNNSSSVFMDNGNKYNNVFEVIYDTFLTALRKVGITNLTVIVGQVGWPTDGIDGANIVNAHRFFKSFIKYILNGKGTPLYPHLIDVYIYNLADESKLKTERGNFIRHWGIYKFDGYPKYNVDFTGQDRVVELTSLKGVIHMPKRWCIFNGATKDMNKIKAQFDIACNISDCTSIAPGGSCSHLKFPHNISYAFNMYFQTKSQKISDDACYFEGLGVIVPDDPSIYHCLFPVEILSSEDSKYRGTNSSGNYTTSYGHLIRPIVESRNSFFMFLLVTMFVLN